MLRLSGLSLLLTCILKLFFWDLRHLETLPRIFSFIALGLILVCVSWIYTRFREHVVRFYENAYNRNLGFRFLRVLVALSTVLVFLAIHELGHAVAALLTGGGVGDFVLFSLRPHVLITGSATNAQETIRAVAGSAASLLTCFVLLLTGRQWRLAKDTAAAFGAVELVGWTLSSLTRSRSLSPDDAERFLAASGISAYPVVAVCGLLALAGYVAFRVSERRTPAPSARAAKAAAAGVSGH